MILSVNIENVQHISSLDFSIDLSLHNITCIVGKNGSGKTTLIRALQNITAADTFKQTASPYIFSGNSKINYSFDATSHEYTYNETINQLDSRSLIDKKIKGNIFVEQPIPFGVRFNHSQKLGNIDEELRKKITLSDYQRPDELISFLSRIYKDNRFDELKEITVKGEKYYFILKDGNNYIREDYFSSGEYFVIHLYKLIQKRCTLIAIDELDISLDSSAQVHLVEELRSFCKTHEVNILFTTHSLALMRTLDTNELMYMQNKEGEVTLEYVSYNYVKSLLFGFRGWDKYILVEDRVLQNFLTYLLENHNNHYSYKIIYIGGGTEVVDLLKRNASEQFFSAAENVIAVLDGDQRDLRYCRDRKDTYCIPPESVEKELAKLYEEGNLGFTVEVNGAASKFAKNLYRQIIRERHLTESDIFGLVYSSHTDKTNELIEHIVSFLNPPRK